MTRKQKQALRQRQSTRQLMGISQLTEHGVKAAGGELVFYLIQPDNLSVLSPEGVRERVRALSDLLRASTEVIMVAVDSRESFQRNKDYYRARLEEETLPAIRELLRQDMEHLDTIQTGTASSREFALLCRMDTQAATDPAQLAQVEKRIHSLSINPRTSWTWSPPLPSVLTRTALFWAAPTAAYWPSEATPPALRNWHSSATLGKRAA